MLTAELLEQKFVTERSLISPEACPALVLNAGNDPFVPAHELPGTQQVGPRVTLWRPAGGGHVGFPHGGYPGRVQQMPTAVASWLAEHA